MSRTAASYSMVWTRGATAEDEFTYTDAAGVPINLTGYQARLQVRTLAGQYGLTTATTLLLELSTLLTPTRLFFDTALGGRLRIKGDADSDVALLNPGNLKRLRVAYSLELFRPAGADPRYVIPLVEGKIAVRGWGIR